MRKILALACAGGAAAALAATAASAPAPGAAVVKLASNPLGRILVDARGRTLYLFEADRGGKSACYGRCATDWPPVLTTAKPRATAGAKASFLGTSKRRDGSLQITYRKHPLYLFGGDRAAGQTLGEELDFYGGEWYAVSAQGAKVEKPSASTGDSSGADTSSSSGGGDGYGGSGGYGYDYDG